MTEIGITGDAFFIDGQITYPGVMAQRQQTTAQMMGANAGFHANQTWRQIHQSFRQLPA